MTALRILADENLALVHEAFGGLGSLQTMPGRAMLPEHLAAVDALLVRSVTRVDAALLQGSSCRFVGTATSGTDHIDRVWLQQQHIGFADAHGCNAEGVVDYVLAALAWLALRGGQNWLQRAVGIVGCGAVGGRLARRLLALGVPVTIHDPFLDQSHPLAHCFASLEAVLQQPVVSLHVPLTHEGPWPTWHLLDAARLAQLQPDAILINAARGAVVDTPALLQHMAHRPGLKVVLDAWEGEPAVDQTLLEKVDIGTPHIAGYSRLGKVRGTLMVREALCRHFGLDLPSVPDAAAAQRRPLPAAAPGPLWQQLAVSILQAFDIARDHQAMQDLRGLAAPAAAAGFDRLRKEYPERREFQEWTVPAGAPPLLAALRACGFRVP